jgi:hypothetical protein
MKIGQRLRSQVGGVEVVVVTAPSEPAELTCGGHPMIDPSAPAPEGIEASEPAGPGVQLGKRYSDAAGTVEVLVTKAGSANLALNGERLEPKVAKPLPASD